MIWDMIGHSWAAKLLQRHIIRGQVRHAYLITGADGLGKRTLALRFAQALCCTGSPGAGEICGECRGCRLILTGSYTDLHRIEPEGPGGLIKVDQIRQLQKQLALAPYEGKWRVAVCLRFHEANESASNALLKTLEEPAEKVVLLLTARSKEALLPTIVSRCEVLPLRPVDRTLIEEALIGRGVPEDQAALVSTLAAGRPGWALAQGLDPEWGERRSKWLDDLIDLMSATRAARFRYLESILEGKDSDAQRSTALEALDQWASLWRDAMLMGYRALEVDIHNIDRSGDLHGMTQKLEAGEISRVLREAEEVRDAIQQNANVRLALETWFLDMPRC